MLTSPLSLPPTHRPLEPAAPVTMLRWLAIAALTFCLGQADRLFQHHDATVPTLLLAPGCLLPFFLWWGNRYWSAAACGAAATMLLMPGIRETAAQSSWISIPMITVGLAVELWLANRLLRAWGFRADLSRGKDVLLFSMAALVATVISGWGVMPIVYWPESLTVWKFLQACGTWWLTHFVSMLVFTPAWLACARPCPTRPREIVLLAVFGGIALVCTTIGFKLVPIAGVPNPLIFFGLPMFILAPLFCGARGAAMVTVVTCLMAAHATAIGIGPFERPDAIDANLSLNLFFISMAVTTYSVGGFITERRDVLGRLEIGHALLKKAEHIAGVGSWQIDAVTMGEQWSDQFYRLIGSMREELAPSLQTFRERFVIDEDRQSFIDAWDSFVRTGQPNRLTFHIRRTDGIVRILQGQAEIQRDIHGIPIRFVGTLQDVTERHQAVEERQRIQQMLNKAEEIAHLGSWEMDGKGFMPLWSENMYRICGLERGQFDGQFDSFLNQIVHPEDRDHLSSTFHKFADGTGPDWADFRIVRGNGEVRHVHAQVQVARRDRGQLIRCYGTTTDVTESKLAEQQLKESEQRYRLLADHCTDVIIRLRANATISYVSPACQSTLGYNAEELLNQSAFDFVAPPDRDRCRDMVFGLLAGEERPSTPYRGVRKNQTEVWLESKAQLVVDASGRRELLCVMRDITERRLFEQQVAEAQRLEAIGRLAGGIAHDFNNILTVINGYAEILESRFPAEDPAAKYVANIMEAGRRAAQLTRQLLTYSRRQLTTRGQISLNDVIRKLQPLLRPLIGEEIELVFHLAPNIDLIEGDVSQIEQVLMNLAANARDAMPEGGFLTFKTEQLHFTAEDPRPRNLPPRDYVRLAVIDTGQGMDESVLSRVFEPFFTTKGAGEGTGLGLATVYATVEHSGGAITVKSEVGEGTRFDLYFPSQPAGSEQVFPAVPVAPLPGPAEVSKRILVVEDDPDVRSFVELALQGARYEVVAAAGGEQALSEAVDANPPFDLLLTDVVMKGLNGREVADRIRTKYPHIPVIFMSGHTDDAVLRHGVFNDEVSLLNKPFSVSRLIQRVQQVFTEESM